METMLNDILVFLEENYVYVVGVGIAIVLILIGFLVSRKKGNKSVKVKENNFNNESMGLESKPFETNNINPVDIAPMNNQSIDFTTNSSFGSNNMNSTPVVEQPAQETEYKPFGFEQPVEAPKVEQPVEQPVEDLEKTMSLSEPISTEENSGELSNIQDKKIDMPYANPSDLDPEDEIETI